MATSAKAWVDYQDIDDLGRVLTLEKFFSPGSRAAVGERVVTSDHEGNRCEGTVVEIEENGVVAIELDEDTFVAGEHPAPAEP
jgi:hypothetical protein